MAMNTPGAYTVYEWPLCRLVCGNDGISVPDIDHEDIKLVDDQQLEAVDNTTIELNESVDLHETKPIGTDE